MRPEQNGHYFPDDIFLNEQSGILILFLMKFVTIRGVTINQNIEKSYCKC